MTLNVLIKAGITNDQLLIALEPEAASLFCRYLPEATGADVFKSDSKYMIIDLGGIYFIKANDHQNTYN